MKNSVKSILNGLGVAILIVDHNQDITYRNKSAKSLFSVAKKAAKLSDVITSKKGLEAAETVLQTGVSSQVRITLQDVVPTSYRVTIAPMEAEAGMRHAILSFEDVSHIRDAEKMREDFVANVSHELRSPLTALYGFIETLQGPAKGDEEATTRFLELMQNESQRMARLIDDLLSLSKFQANERVAPKESANLKDIIAGVAETLDGIGQKEDIEVKIELSEDLPQVIGNHDELAQVFRNLIENAIKYSGRGTQVSVLDCAEKKTKKHVCICIRDQGEGIELKHIPRLTERFYRIDKGRSRAKGGTGLGLAIVKHILIRHRGWLEIKSEEGVGSTFSVYLPFFKGS